MKDEERVDLDDELETPDGDDGATEPATEEPATETPLKVKVDGVGELTPEEIREALDAKKRLADYDKQRSSWEASQHKKGEELNAGLRKVGELERELSGKMADLERVLREPRQPEIDPSSIEDPVERQKYEITTLRREIAGLRGELTATAAQVKAEQDAKTRREIGEYWTGQLDGALDRHTEGLSDAEVKSVKRIAKGILGETTADRWTPDLFDSAVKEARADLEAVKQNDRRSYSTAAKERVAKNITVKSGTATGNKMKTRDQFKSQDEWLAYLDKVEGG